MSNSQPPIKAYRIDSEDLHDVLADEYGVAVDGVAPTDDGDYELLVSNGEDH